MGKQKQWSEVTDDELFAAQEHLDEYTQDGILAILAEVARRGKSAESLADRAAQHDHGGRDSESMDSLGTQLEKRYRDAYRVARTTTMIAGVIKFVGIVAGAVGIGVALLSIDRSATLATVSAVAGAFIGLVVYGLGILAAAQGQQLMASIDGVIGGSPFLTDRNRAAIMQLDVGGDV